MKLLTLAAACVVVVSIALAACGGGDSSGGADEALIRSAIDREVAAIRAEDWKAVYAFGSPNARATCSESEFVSNSQAFKPSEGRTWAKVGVRVTDVSVDGNTAEVTGVPTYDGEDFAEPSTDEWTKIGGIWYIADTGSSCSIS